MKTALKKFFTEKIKSPKQKILITLLYISFIAVLYIFNIQCFFKQLFGIPCPGCGMTRALISACMFDLSTAFSYHLMFWSLPIMYIYFLCDGTLFKNKKIDRIIWIIILAGFAINWVIHLIGA